MTRAACTAVSGHAIARVARTALALLAACSQSIDVLQSAPPVQPPFGDAGQLPDPDDLGQFDAGRPGAECDACAIAQLCAVDRCVDAAGITSLASSFGHTCRIEDGQLFCWGNGELGQLGTGNPNDRPTPARVGSFNDWLQVSPAETSTCALRAPGVVYCWGDNASGQLGQGDTEPRAQPSALPVPKLVREVACGGTSCCAIDRDDELWCWGDNLEGKAGLDDPYGSQDVTSPQATAGGARWRTLAIGQGHVCGIQVDGSLWCWGRNINGELGIGSEPGQVRAPVRVGDANDWRAIAASQHHSCGVREDGSLQCWGSNAFFELAAPDPAAIEREPRRVGSDADWDAVGAGWFHGCARKRDASMYCWGRGIEGQLGRPLPIDGQLVDLEGWPLPEPGQVDLPARWRRIMTGSFHTCGIDEAGATLCWGANEGGQLGVGDVERRQVPEPVL